MDYEKILESLKICSEVGTSCEGCSGRGERHCIANLTKAAAITIETLLHALDMARRERDAVTRHMIELEHLYKGKSEIDWYDDETRLLLVRDFGWACVEPSWECDGCKCRKYCSWHEEEGTD